MIFSKQRESLVVNYVHVQNRSLTAVVMFRFLGTSGQNIDDLFKYSEAKNKLEFMERTLRWRHLVPTAPNTLGNITLANPFF